MKIENDQTVIPAQAGIHKLLILLFGNLTGFRPAPE